MATKNAERAQAVDANRSPGDYPNAPERRNELSGISASTTFAAAQQEPTMHKTRANRDDLKKSLSRLRKSDLIELLGTAFDILPKTKRAPVFGDLLDPVSTHRSKKVKVSAPALLNEVVDFHAASLKEKFRDDFEVNSKTFKDESEGTAQWRRDINRLFDRVVAAGKKGDAQTICRAFELLFDLLLRLDDGEDFVFFADEGGSWQIGAEYEKIFPAYFSCLAEVTEPGDYARKSYSLIASLEEYAEKKHLTLARKAANKEQQRALRELLKKRPDRWEETRWLREVIGQPSIPSV